MEILYIPANLIIMKLVIAEKPSVARSIYPVLGANKKCDGYMEGNGYIVSWCFGHLAQLYMPNDYGDEWSGKWTFEQLPMMPEIWKFKINPDAEEQFNILKKLLNDNSIDEVICATDADREGECIFRYVYNLSGSRKPVKRLWISSLEEEAVRTGFENLKDIKEYDNLYAAGLDRAKADWLVGMNGSRLFSCRYNARLNLGRVQTPTLAMIVKRDNEIKKFKKQKYYTVELDCGNFKAASDRMDDEHKADKIAASCLGKTATVKEVIKEIKTINPPKLYDLTSLQRDANKIFGYTAQQTLDFQQSLYEAKLSTYPRTDSQYITDDMAESVSNLMNKLQNVIGDINTEFCTNISQLINNKKVVSHPAILPTEKVDNESFSKLSDGEKNILLLEIARLFCAASHPYKYEAVKAIITCNNTDFTSIGKTVIQAGWREIDGNFKRMYKSNEAKTDKDTEETVLPELGEGQRISCIAAEKMEHYTTPPKAYTEDTLLSAMEHAGRDEYDDENTEKKGLGTPATRASTLEGLVKRGYVERKGKKISATEKGINLIKAVPTEVKSPKLTAEWETKLQKVEHGHYAADIFMSEIENFVRDICMKYSSVDNSISFGERGASVAIGKCPKCGSDVIKGKFGWYCSSKCGMIIAKVFGKELTEEQLKKLLTGKEIPFESGGKKLIVLPKAVSNEYNDKVYYQWGTKKL